MLYEGQGRVKLLAADDSQSPVLLINLYSFQFHTAAQRKWTTGRPVEIINPPTRRPSGFNFLGSQVLSDARRVSGRHRRTRSSLAAGVPRQLFSCCFCARESIRFATSSIPPSAANSDRTTLCRRVSNTRQSHSRLRLNPCRPSPSSRSRRAAR